MATPQQSASLLASDEFANADGIAEVLAWLGKADSADPTQDLALLQVHLTQATKANLSISQFHRLLDLFHARAETVSRLLRPHLASAATPLERTVRSLATKLQDVHGTMARGYLRVMEDLLELQVRNKRRSPAVVAVRGLKCLYEELKASFAIAAPPPAGLWRKAHLLYASACSDSEPGAAHSPEALEAEQIYKAMLAQWAAQPEGCSSAETAAIADYLERYSGLVDLMPQRPDDGSASWFWLDTSADGGPVPSNRRIPSDHGPLIFASFLQLGRRLEEQLAQLNAADPEEVSELPEAVLTPAGLGFLQRAQTRWCRPPHRHHSRRRNTYRAHVCMGLEDLWQLLQNGKADAETVPTSEWMVLNESPAGFAVMHVAGDVSGTRAGSIIALRGSAEQAWNICIVRWIRSENPEHIELGLELIASGAESVNIVFRDERQGQNATPGLLLPPARALRQHPAILAPSGSHGSRRFFIVSGEDQTRVAQGRLLSLDLQTDSVELFQFEADPYPL